MFIIVLLSIFEEVSENVFHCTFWRCFSLVVLDQKGHINVSLTPTQGSTNEMSLENLPRLGNPNLMSLTHYFQYKKQYVHNKLQIDYIGWRSE